MKFFVDIGKPNGARGGLSQLNAKDALMVAHQLRLAGVQDVYIQHVKTGARVAEADLEAFISKQHGKSPMPHHPADEAPDKHWIT
jgi:hypothetical protein